MSQTRIICQGCGYVQVNCQCKLKGTERDLAIEEIKHDMAREIESLKAQLAERGILTKQEHFASMALQGYNANPQCYEWEREVKAKTALEDANELIRELEK